MYIPKADGRERPLGIAALEDKIVQGAMTEVLNAIYEADFLGFSYGFRPGRSPNDALDALATGLTRGKMNWVLDADIRGFFDAISHEWMRKFLQHRIGDRRVLRLIDRVGEAANIKALFLCSGWFLSPISECLLSYHQVWPESTAKIYQTSL